MREASGPSQKRTDRIQRNVDQRIPEQEDVEDAARVVAEDLDEILEQDGCFSSRRN